MRLTRRGRALVRSLVLLAAVLTALVVMLASRHDEVTPVASRSMVVSEHDTLWSIAERVAPDQPLSVTMAQIQKLNDMPDATVRVGQRLLLPATPNRASGAR